MGLQVGVVVPDDGSEIVKLTLGVEAGAVAAEGDFGEGVHGGWMRQK
jgi:hypothetical protein